MAGVMVRQGEDEGYKSDLIEHPAELGAPGVIQFDEFRAGAEEIERKVDMGYVYDPLVRSILYASPFQLELPPSVWSHCALCFLPRIGPREFPSVHPGWPFISCISEQHYLSSITVVLAFGIGFAQMYLAFAIFDSGAHDENQMCEGGDHWVRMLCMFIFVLVMSENAYASYQIARYVYEIPAWEDGMTAVLRKSDGLSRILYRSKEIQGPVGPARITVPVTGLSRAFRAYINFCVAFKFVAELMVLIAGMGLIARSPSNADLIANSVAVTFIAEVDDIAERALVSPADRRVLAEAFPSIGLEFKEPGDPMPGSLRRVDMIGIHSPMFQPLTIAALVALSHQWWCGAGEAEPGLLD